LRGHPGRWAILLTAFFACAAQGQDRLQACAACHGADGNSATPGVPSIAGQPRRFLENQLVLIREGMRANAPMESLLRGVTDGEIIAMARHYAALPARPAAAAADRALAARGRALAAKLRCGICHLPDYRGQQHVPRLAGQREDYLLEAMRAFRDQPKPGSDTMMSAALYGVGDADLRALAHYLSRRK